MSAHVHHPFRPPAEILQFRKELESAKSERTMLDVLERLTHTTMTIEILKSTNIGRVVGKLRKHESEELAKKARELVEKWKDLVSSPPVPKKVKTVPTTATSSSSSSNDNKGISENKNKGTSTSETSSSMTPVIGKLSLNKSESSVSTQQSSNSTSPRPTTPTNSTPSSSSSTPNTPRRTSSSSNIPSVLPSTEKECREAVVTKFVTALSIGSSSDDKNIELVAGMIETEIFDMFKGITKDYKAKVRSLHFNLKDEKNPELRANVLSGVLSPMELCRMDPREMASSAMKEWRKKTEEKMTFNAQVSTGAAATTDQFKCGKCGKRQCTYFQLQTRSADEPMTTFITCTNCNNRWKQY